VSFQQGIGETVDWFRANEGWWRAIRSGEWDAYYARQYGARLAGGVAAGSPGGSPRGAETVAAAAQAHEPAPELG